MGFFVGSPVSTDSCEVVVVDGASTELIVFASVISAAIEGARRFLTAYIGIVGLPVEVDDAALLIFNKVSGRGNVRAILLGF